MGVLRNMNEKSFFVDYLFALLKVKVFIMVKMWSIETQKHPAIIQQRNSINSLSD